jgi:predicted nucleotide-binding protein
MEVAMKVFLSHSSKDNEFAKQIKETLKGLCDVYIASDDRQPGQYLSKKIEDNIRSSSFFIALITKDAFESQWVNQEIGLAKNCKINIIPIVEQGIRPPGILEGLEYIEFNRNNTEVTIKSLYEYMEKKKKERDRSDLITLSLFLAGLFLLIEKK